MTRKLIEIFVDGLFMTTSKVLLVVNPLQPSMSSFILFSECIVINDTVINQSRNVRNKFREIKVPQAPWETT